jgi:hypothetical protein
MATKYTLRIEDGSGDTFKSTRQYTHAVLGVVVRSEEQIAREFMYLKDDADRYTSACDSLRKQSNRELLLARCTSRALADVQVMTMAKRGFTQLRIVPITTVEM